MMLKSMLTYSNFMVLHYVSLTACSEIKTTHLSDTSSFIFLCFHVINKGRNISKEIRQ